MDRPRSLSDFLDHSFFERGAFITSYENDDVLLARGGDIRSTTSSSSLQNAFYLKDFYNDRFLTYSPLELFKTTLKELREFVGAWSFPQLSVESIENEDLLYAQDFNRLKNSFSSKLKKVVLVSREEFTLRGALEARRRFFARAVLYGTGLPSGIWFDDYGMVGSTPELLFSITDEKIKTYALAGTAAKDKGEELLQSPKDRDEHKFVISDIVEKLSSFGKTVRVGETVLHPYKNIVHLKTDIELLTEKDFSALRLAEVLSPTAALGGYPKKGALEFLVSTDYAKRHPNRYFGSAFGFVSGSLNQAVVMIRNIQWRGNRFIIESGGGVVEGSVLEKELDEIYMKRESIKGHYL